MKREVVRVAGPDRRRAWDAVAVEEPLEVQLGGVPYQVTMRTPGHDFDLVAGLLLSEGVVTARADIVRMAAGLGAAVRSGVDAFNVVDVALSPEAAARAAARGTRRVATTSACGVCGTTSLADLATGHAPVGGDRLEIPAAVLAALPATLRAAQPGFARTGGSHAAGLFDGHGRLVCAREDVGRHNAFDKVVGWALLDGRLPLRGHVLLASGRASYELVHKAVTAGVPLVAAVSAPSSAAVDLATVTGLTLVGFLRGDTMNVYAGASRISPARGGNTAL